MATKQFYATRDFKYGTRMMRAGDPVEMTAPHARLYGALNAISETKPKAITSLARADADGSGNLIRNTPPAKPVAAKATAKKRAAPRKKAASKKK